MPVRSSKVSLAIRVSPDRLFWTFLTCTPVIIPPRITSAFSGTPARSATRWVASACKSAGVAGQGVARHVEAERPSSPRRAARRRAVRGRRAGSTRSAGVAVAVPWPSAAGSAKASKRLRWPRLRSSCFAWPAWTARGRTASNWLRRRPEAVERPGLDQRLDARLADDSSAGPARRSRPGSRTAPLARGPRRSPRPP